MKVYVAARTARRVEVKNINKQLIALGHEVFDWTWHKNTKPYLKNQKVAEKYAIEDVNWVKNCDLFILLTDEPAGNGSTTEFGMALLSSALFKKPKIYIVGERLNNMFFMHPNVNIRKSVKEIIKEI